MASIDRWNERYRSGEGGPAGAAPLVIEAAALVAPGRALDLACGPGRNAIYLAQRGWEVVAIDASEVAIDQLRRADSRIDARLLDLERQPLPLGDDAFDMICIINFLHRPLFAAARRIARPGGIVVSAIHTVRSTMNPEYTMAAGELRNFFAGWEMLIDREDQIAEIVARKPLTGIRHGAAVPYK